MGTEVFGVCKGKKHENEAGLLCRLCSERNLTFVIGRSLCEYYVHNVA